jgi:hypothetical protein
MKKIILYVLFVIITFMIVQTIRYNSKGSNVQNLEFTNLNNQKVKLKDVFNKTNNKFILYILPDCESCIDKIKEFSSIDNSQLIVVSVGLKKFNYNQYYLNNFKDNKIIFLIDKENSFYKYFGFGFTENFPTLVKYDYKNDSYAKIY